MAIDQSSKFSRIIKQDIERKEALKALNNKVKTFSVRLTDADYEILCRACEQEGVKKSLFTQQAIMYAVSGLVKQQEA